MKLMVDAIRVPEYRQRMADNDLGYRYLVEHFNPDLATPIIVNNRTDDGGTYVVDGRKRLLAARERGDETIEADVLALSERDEAARWIAQNTSTRVEPAHVDPVPCIVCGRKLESVMAAVATQNQPYGGTAFRSYGHYGSTVFDPMDGSFLEVVVCDICLAVQAKQGVVLSGRELERMERTMAPWMPPGEGPGGSA